VGTSNLLEGPVAQRLLGDPGPVSVRPEKITLLPPGDPLPTGGDVCTARGVVREVVYLGAATHCVVDLDAGGTLTVLQQNLDTSPTRLLDRRGEPVTLCWRRLHVVSLGTTRPSTAAEVDQLTEETP
jgi:putative spermidine/putrescine transport system ATP-binding protein